MDTESPRLRLRILGIIAVSLFGALFARLWYLQIMNPGPGEVEATANRVRVLAEEAPRGRILDAKGRVLVDNRTSLVVTIDPHELAGMTKDQRADLQLRLAEELTRSGIPTKVAGLQRRLADPQYSPLQPIPVAIDVPEDLEIYLAEHADEFPGVQVRRESVRRYPNGSLAAHVLGYVGRISDAELVAKMGPPGDPRPAAKPYQPDSGIGKTGIERIFEDDLRGTPGQRRIEVDAKGRPIRTIDYSPPVPGDDVQLAVDLDVQKVTEERLASQLESSRGSYTNEGYVVRAPAGSAVVLDPSNGHVVAMASYPTYDPTEFVNGISTDRYQKLVGGAASDNPLTNRAIGGLYAPGSTFKLVTADAALTKGVTSGDRWIYDNGVYRVGNRDFQNAQRAAHGSVNMSKAITVSSDVYFYQLGDLFWKQRDQYGDGIQEAARKFGYGAPTGVDLPGELGGVVPDPTWKKQIWDGLPDDQKKYGDGRWYAGDNVNLAIGQGDMLATPLQIADSYATFANGGTRYRPMVGWRVLRAGTDATDEAAVSCSPGAPGCAVVRVVEPEVQARVELPPEVDGPIREGLEGVTSHPQGTATDVFKGFDQRNFPVAGKTGTAQSTGKADNSLFVAYAPANDPRYVAAVVLEQAGFGAEAAAPVVRTIFEFVSGQQPHPCTVTTSWGATTTTMLPADQPCPTSTTTTAPGAGGYASGAGGGATTRPASTVPTTRAPTATTIATTTTSAAPSTTSVRAAPATITTVAGRRTAQGGGP